MSKRAEQRGLETLPPRWRKTKDGKGKIDSALPVRKFYIRAYEQAEKDLALTADDIRQIIKINYEIIFQDTTGIKCKDVAEETLRMFNQWKEEQK